MAQFQTLDLYFIPVAYVQWSIYYTIKLMNYLTTEFQSRPISNLIKSFFTDEKEVFRPTAILKT